MLNRAIIYSCPARIRQSESKVKILQYIYALLITGAVLHTPLHAADLMEVYREALEQDAQYSSARAAHQAAQEKLPQGRAGLLPTLTLSGVRRRQLIDRVGHPEVSIDNSSLTITATQPIYRKENFSIYEQSKIQVTQADSQFIIAAQDLILRVAQAYFDVLSAQVNVEVAEAQKKLLESNSDRPSAISRSGHRPLSILMKPRLDSI